MLDLPGRATTIGTCPAVAMITSSVHVAAFWASFTLVQGSSLPFRAGPGRGACCKRPVTSSSARWSIPEEVASVSTSSILRVQHFGRPLDGGAVCTNTSLCCMTEVAICVAPRHSAVLPNMSRPPAAQAEGCATRNNDKCGSPGVLQLVWQTLQGHAGSQTYADNPSGGLHTLELFNSPVVSGNFFHLAEALKDSTHCCISHMVRYPADLKSQLGSVGVDDKTAPLLQLYMTSLKEFVSWLLPYARCQSIGDSFCTIPRTQGPRDCRSPPMVPENLRRGRDSSHVVMHKPGIQHGNTSRQRWKNNVVIVRHIWNIDVEVKNMELGR